MASANVWASAAGNPFVIAVAKMAVASQHCASVAKETRGVYSIHRPLRNAVYIFYGEMGGSSLDGLRIAQGLFQRNPDIVVALNRVRLIIDVLYGK